VFKGGGSHGGFPSYLIDPFRHEPLKPESGAASSNPILRKKTYVIGYLSIAARAMIASTTSNSKKE
jgi:hypothetical protein